MSRRRQRHALRTEADLDDQAPAWPLPCNVAKSQRQRRPATEGKPVANRAPVLVSTLVRSPRRIQPAPTVRECLCVDCRRLTARGWFCSRHREVEEVPAC